ncbi:hypothetical protein [Photobacterium lipolyticum]|uniref:hypothetical protein n=1 Tax=Photobacterium lipolyticum TaxID=266810 RepID=UPI001475D8E3|nr:hypothetical protein [Photobacterium lipolyticum]
MFIFLYKRALFNIFGLTEGEWLLCEQLAGFGKLSPDDQPETKKWYYVFTLATNGLNGAA